MLRNCNVSVDDITRAEVIFGKAKPLCKGKMTKISSPSLQVQKIPLPPSIAKHHQRISLYIDIFFVNKIPFFHTKSGKINFLTTQVLQSRSALQIIKGLLIVKKIYKDRGFIITDVHGDNEFNIKKLKEVLSPTNLHLCAQDEHVPIIERSIRTVKERSRSTTHALPFRRFPRILTVNLVEAMTSWLNAFPTTTGVSQSISPATIVLGKMAPDVGNKTIGFGQYAMVHFGTKNNMRQRSIEGIALRPSNENNGFYFMSLRTGHEIHSNNWDELPLDEWAIQQVEKLAEQEGQPLIPDKSPLFEWAPGVPIEDIDGVDEIHDPEPTIEPYMTTPHEVIFADEIEENNTNDENDNHTSEENNENNNDHLDAFGNNAQQDNFLIDKADNGEDEPQILKQDKTLHFTNTEENVDFEQNPDIPSAAEDAEAAQNQGAHNNISTDPIPTDPISTFSENDSDYNPPTNEYFSDLNENTENNNEDDITIEERAPRRSSRVNAGGGVSRLIMDPSGKTYNLHNAKQFLMRTKRVKKHVLIQRMHNHHLKTSNYMAIATNFMFTQMSARKGIKQFGERAVAALMKEFRQLIEGAVPGKPVIKPLNADSLSFEDKKKAMEAVTFIKEKRCGTIKGRSCANGSGQRKYLKENESVASPTCVLESHISTLIIDAYENRDVAVFDIPGAYLHAETPKDKLILMVFRDIFVDILCEVNPDVKKYVKIINGKKILYVKVLQAIYGCIESALLWYNFYVDVLKKEGFELNPYDRCVANKMVNGKQCTLVWYVDDNKISHEDPKIVDKMIEKINEYFGKVTVSRGKEHHFLGIKFKIRDDKKVELSAKDQIESAIKLIEELEVKIETNTNNPAAKNLMYVDDKSPLLDEKRGEVFHSVTGKCLYFCKRIRPDVDPTVAFLTTRVSMCTEQDWKKLLKLIGFLKGTIDDVRIVGASSLQDLYTWIDAAYGVHNNMRSQTGGAMSFGYGIVHGKSSKQKLNTKSSTESELVEVSEYLPYNIWLINFLKYQGYIIKNNVVYQDNQSAIRMEINGRNSCTGNSRHIDIRYFFVKDRVDKKEVKIVYCPTEQMLADFYTKPLNGSLFKFFREVIMGWRPITDLYKVANVSTKERVEDTSTEDTNKQTVQEVAEKSTTLHRRKLTWAEVVSGAPTT